MRVVLDANIFVSALIVPHGYPGQIFNLWTQDIFELAISLPIIEEVNRVIHYPRIRRKYNLPEEEVIKFLQLISTTAIAVNPAVNLNVIQKDPSDNRYIEFALAASAAYIITGDAHLLDLKQYSGINILTPASFIALLRLEEENQ